MLEKVREGDLLSKKENGPKGLQQDSIVLIKTLLNLDGDEYDAQREEIRYVEQKLLHQNFKQALSF